MKKRKRNWPHMIENVLEKVVQVNLRKDLPPPTQRKIARMNAPLPIDEMISSENENEKDDFSKVGDVCKTDGGDALKEIESFIQ